MGNVNLFLLIKWTYHAQNRILLSTVNVVLAE